MGYKKKKKRKYRHFLVPFSQLRPIKVNYNVNCISFILCVKLLELFLKIVINEYGTR